jgi:hypothetical protein
VGPLALFGGLTQFDHVRDHFRQLRTWVKVESINLTIDLSRLVECFVPSELAGEMN